jgi:hypothetical protein
MVFPTQGKSVHMYMQAWVMLRSFHDSTHTNPTGFNAAGNIYRHMHYPVVYVSLEFALVGKVVLHMGGRKSGVILFNLVLRRLDKFSFV